jgi:hypothetical protein
MTKVERVINRVRHHDTVGFMPSDGAFISHG